MAMIFKIPMLALYAAQTVRDEFEKNNFILYPKGYTYENFYFEVRRKFFETAIKKGQKKAIEIIKSMK